MSDKYPYNHVDVTDFVTHSTAALHNQQGQAMANVINSLPVFKVDPDNAECYSTVNLAYAAADAALPAGDPIVIELAPGKNHTLIGDLTVGTGRSVYIKSCQSTDMDGGGTVVKTTRITGNLVLPAADSGDRRTLSIEGVELIGNVTEGSNWYFLFQSGMFSGSISRTHGTNGAKVEFHHTWHNGNFTITDADNSPSTAKGTIVLRDADASFAERTSGWTLGANVYVYLYQANIYAVTSSVVSKVFNINSKTGVRFFFYNSTIRMVIYGNSMTLFGSANASRAYWYGNNTITIEGYGNTTALGTGVTHYAGVPLLISDTKVADCPSGTRWTVTTSAKPREFIYTAGSYPIWRDLSMPKYFVDASAPAGVGAYAKISDAFAAADAEEAAGAEIEIVVADGTYSDAVNFGTDHPIVLKALSSISTKITGALTFGPYAAVKRSRIELCELNNTINVKDGASIVADKCYCNATAFALDPTAGSVGYWTRLQSCTVASPTIVEGATASGTRLFVIDGGTVTLSSMGVTPISIYKLYLKFLNIAQENLEWGVGYTPLINCNSDSAKVWFSNFNVMNYYVGTGLTAWFSNAASATVFFDSATFRGQATGKTMSFGTIGTVLGIPTIISDTVPAVVPVGTIWEDTSLGDILIWDGTNWRSGDVVRLDVRVNVGSAAAFFSVGSTVPSGAAALEAQLNLDKAITGAAGADRLALVDTTGSPNVWASTLALTKNSKASEVFAPLVRSIGDDLYLAAMSGLVPGGTIAGSGALDVRVVVRYRSPVALPNA